METFTLSAIATAAGMAVVVTTLVQISKYYLDKLSPKWLALAWSAILNLAAFAWLGRDHSLQAAFTMVINILYISAAANGVFQYVVKPRMQGRAGRSQGRAGAEGSDQPAVGPDQPAATTLYRSQDRDGGGNA